MPREQPQAQPQQSAQAPKPGAGRPAVTRQALWEMDPGSPPGSPQGASQQPGTGPSGGNPRQQPAAQAPPSPPPPPPPPVQSHPPPRQRPGSQAGAGAGPARRGKSPLRTDRSFDDVLERFRNEAGSPRNAPRNIISPNSGPPSGSVWSWGAAAAPTGDSGNGYFGEVGDDTQGWEGGEAEERDREWYSSGDTSSSGAPDSHGSHRRESPPRRPPPAASARREHSPTRSAAGASSGFAEALSAEAARQRRYEMDWAAADRVFLGDAAQFDHVGGQRGMSKFRSQRSISFKIRHAAAAITTRAARPCLFYCSASAGMTRRQSGCEFFLPPSSLSGSRLRRTGFPLCPSRTT